MLTRPVQGAVDAVIKVQVHADPQSLPREKVAGLSQCMHADHARYLICQVGLMYSKFC